MTEPTPCEKCGRHYRPLRRGYCHRCDMRRRARHGYQCSFVDATAARDHVAALRAAGIGLRRLSALSGVSRSALSCLVNGRSERGSSPSRRLGATTAAAILAVDIPEAPHDQVAGGQHVDAIGTVRRMQSLVAYGYPRYYLADRLGIAPGNATALFDPATLRVTAATARKVAALFAELEATPGPSQRAKNDGARRGWEPPLAWDEREINHFMPTTEPAEHSASEPTVLERYAELRFLGYSDEQIADREGIAVASLHVRLTKARAALASAITASATPTPAPPGCSIPGCTAPAATGGLCDECHDDLTCPRCGDRNDNGEGFDGYCGNCADQLETAGHWD